MENWIVIIILIAVVGAACFYIWKSRKNGKKCIGCPMSGCCSSGDGVCGSLSVPDGTKNKK